jgi:glutamate dehydrogenase (NAD(P)+)
MTRGEAVLNIETKD